MAACDLHCVDLSDAMDANVQTGPARFVRRLFAMTCRQQGRTYSDIARALGRDDSHCRSPRHWMYRFKTEPGYDWDREIRNVIIKAGGTP